jgi:hypothetical protein
MTSPTAPGPELHCVFLNDDPSNHIKQVQVNNNVSESITLSQDVGKKSSFILPAFTNNNNNHLAIPTPAHMILEYRVDGKPQIFYLGGFQLVSNARHVEVYLSDNQGKETYLMTSKGISFEGDYYKAVSVVPGGPRPITRLHVKLLSLRPMTGETTAKLQSLKVTARCPESSSSSSSSGETTTTATTTTSDNKTTANNSSYSSSYSSSSSPPLTQSDLGAAMASMSIMARSTENHLEQTLQDRFTSMEQNLGVRWTKMEHHILQLTSVVVSQKQVMLEQNGLVIKQQHKLVDQGNVINELMVQQTELLQLTQKLQRDLETMQQDQKESRERRERGDLATVKSLHKDLEELRQQQRMEREMKELELAELELENVKSQESNNDDDDDDDNVVQEAEVEDKDQDNDKGAEVGAATEVELLPFDDEEANHLPQQDREPSSGSGPEATDDIDKGAEADAATKVELLSFDDEDTTTPPQQDRGPSSDSGPAMDVSDKQSFETVDSKEEEEEKKDSEISLHHLSEVNELGNKSASEDAPEGDLLGLEGDLLELGQDDQPSE